MWSVTVLSVGLVVAGPPAADLPTSPGSASVHRPHVEQYWHHGMDIPKERAPGWTDRSHQALEAASGPSREVLGYLPYWELDYDEFHWDKLTTLAFFAADMNSEGDLTDLHGWTGSTSIALRDEAHANNVRYVLTIVNFEPSSIEALVNNPARRAHAIEVMLNAVMSMGADGVNIDFEGVPVTAKAGLTAFMTETTQAFHAAIPGSYVTMATPAVDWEGAFDYDELAENSDGLMIMGYGYHWSGGPPGPLSPPVAGGIWGEKTLTWTIEDYFKWGKEENRHKFLLGLPFYGYDWVADGPDIPGQSLGTAEYEPFYLCLERANALGGFLWDEHSHPPDQKAGARRPPPWDTCPS